MGTAALGCPGERQLAGAQNKAATMLDVVIQRLSASKSRYFGSGAGFGFSLPNLTSI